MKRLKATSKRKHTLANGTVKTYKYPRKPTRRPSGVTVMEALTAYRESPAWKNLRASTKLNNARYMKMFEDTYAAPDELGREHLLKDIDRRHVMSLRDNIITLANTRSQSKSGHGAGMVFVRAISRFFSWCVEYGYIPFSPATNLGKDLVIGTLLTWTKEEYELCKRHLPVHYSRVIQMAYATALRASDLCAMQWEQITERGVECIGEHQQLKNGQQGIIPLKPDFMRELMTDHVTWKWGDPKDYVLLNKLGQPYNPKTLSSRLGYAIRKLGVERQINTHGIRKLVCTQLADSGSSPYEIMGVSGHKHPNSVATYVQMRDRLKLAKSAMAKRWDDEDGRTPNNPL